MEFVTFLALVVIFVLLVIVRNELSEVKGSIDKVARELHRLSSGAGDRLPENDDIPVPEAQPDPVMMEEEPDVAVPPVVLPPPIPVMQSEAPEPTPPAPERERGNWERKVGVNLFSKIGILVLIVGIGFFVKYAIDRNWINEMARTLAGMGVGLVLWGVAYRLRENYRNFSSILAGGGFAVCFVSVAIGFHLYSIFSPAVALILLVALTAVMTLAAVRYDRPELAVTAIVGGFVAPFIASDGSGSFLFVLCYMALLDTAMLVVTLCKRWWALPVVSCVLTYIVCAFGAGLSDIDYSPVWGLVIVIYYFIIFSVPVVHILCRNELRHALTAWLVVAMTLNGVACMSLGIMYADHISDLRIMKSMVPFVCGVVNFGLLMRYCRDRAGIVRDMLIIFVVAFAAFTVLVQFVNPGVRLSCLGLVSALMIWLYCRTGEVLYRRIGVTVGVPLCVIMLLFSWIICSYDAAWGYIVTGVAYVAVAVMVDISFRVFDRKHRNLFMYNLWGGTALTVIGSHGVFDHYLLMPAADGMTLVAIAAVMLFVSIRFPIARYGGVAIPAVATLLFAAIGDPVAGEGLVNLPLIISVPLFALLFACHGIRAFSRGEMPGKRYMVYFNLFLILFAEMAVYDILFCLSLSRLYSVGVSLTLVACGAAQMITGMRRHDKTLRIMAICVLGVVLGKLVVYDIWRMVPVGRIIVFILLGIILLAVSFLYQRLQGLFTDDPSDPPA